MKCVIEMRTGYINIPATRMEYTEDNGRLKVYNGAYLVAVCDMDYVCTAHLSDGRSYHDDT